MEAQHDQHNVRRSCQTCATAKAKCIFPTEDETSTEKCERCTRLNKTCVPQAPSAQRRRPTKQNRTHGGQVERKLDDIVNLLGTRLDAPSTTSAKRGSDCNPIGPNLLPHISYVWRTPAEEHAPAGTSSSDAVLIDRPLPSVKLSFAEMAEAVDAWRPQLAVHFPFAALYEGQSTTWLLVERPYLATAIAVAALYGHLDRQTELARGLIKDISDAMLMKGEKNLDLLEGILVLLAWYHYHVFHNAQTSNLHHLAAALLVDLGLNRPPDRLRAQKLQYFANRWLHGPLANRELHSMSERRALAGCYYMSSTIWCAFKKLDVTPYSPHIDAACNALDEARELPSDILLVQLVRGQRLLERIERGMGPDDAAEAGLPETPMAAVLFVEQFERELQELKGGVPEELSGHANLQLLHHTAATTLYEIAFNNLHTLCTLRKPTTYTPNSSTQTTTTETKRTNYLHSTLRSITQFFSLLFATVSPSSYYSQAFDFWARLSHTLLALARLSSMPGVRDVAELGGQISGTPFVTFEEVVEKSASAWEEAERSARFRGLPLGDNHLFTRWAARLRTFKETTATANRTGDRNTRPPISDQGVTNLQRLNAEATFPGHDPALLADVERRREGEGGFEAQSRKRRREQDRLGEEERRRLDAEGWDVDKLEGFAEGPAVQCPMS